MVQPLSNGIGCTLMERLLFLRDEVDDPAMETFWSLCALYQALNPPFVGERGEGRGCVGSDSRQEAGEEIWSLCLFPVGLSPTVPPYQRPNALAWTVGIVSSSFCHSRSSPVLHLGRPSYLLQLLRRLTLSPTLPLPGACRFWECEPFLASPYFTKAVVAPTVLIPVSLLDISILQHPLNQCPVWNSPCWNGLVWFLCSSLDSDAGGSTIS